MYLLHANETVRTISRNGKLGDSSVLALEEVGDDFLLCSEALQEFLVILVDSWEIVRVLLAVQAADDGAGVARHHVGKRDECESIASGVRVWASLVFHVLLPGRSIESSISHKRVLVRECLRSGVEDDLKIVVISNHFRLRVTNLTYSSIRMVLEVGADSIELYTGFDARSRQDIFAANTTQLKQLGCLDSTCCQNDFLLGINGRCFA